MVTEQAQPGLRLLYVRFGSKADMCSAQADVRFVPIADVQSGRVASIDGEIPADNAIVTAASAGGSSESDASMAGTSTTVAADLHRPIPAATGRYRGCDGLAPAKHHVSAVRRRLHPHSPCTSLVLASHRHILCNGTRRPSTLHEASVIEAVAASHVIGVLLSECGERGTIGIAQFDPYNRSAKGSKQSK